MSVDLSEVQKKLNSLNSLASSLKDPTAVQNLVSTFVLSKTSTLGTSVGNIAGGFQSLTQDVDDIVPSVPGSAPDQLTNVLGITQLTSDLPGLQNQLLVDYPSTSSDLTSITGSSSTKGLLDIVVAAPFPDAIAAAVNDTVSAGGDQLINVVSQLQSPIDVLAQDIIEDIGEFATNIVTTIDQALDPVLKGLSDINTALNAALSSPIGGLLSSISTAIPSGPMLETITSPNEFTSLSGIVPRSVGAQYDDAGKPTYNNIHTEEELELDLRSASREITEMVVHWTETNTDQNLTSRDFDRIVGSVPYHYIIKRNGTIERGLSLDKIGATLANGHERYSIQVAFVGGVNSPTGNEQYELFLSPDSITSEQMLAFEKILTKAYLVWPGLQALGHNDIDRTAMDPGFSVPAFVKSFNGKTNIFSDTFNQPPFSRSTLLNVKVDTRK